MWDKYVLYVHSMLISSNLAVTLDVKNTQSLTKVNAVEPVMSSHWAGVEPPSGQEGEGLRVRVRGEVGGGVGMRVEVGGVGVRVEG